MSRQSELAFAHQRDRIALGHTLAARTMALWRRMDVRDLNAHWDIIAPLMVDQVSAAQLVAAKQATRYVNAIDSTYPSFTPQVATINPAAFTNVMGDGRAVAPALFGAVTNTKTLIGQGVATRTAFESGARFIAMIASSALNDMGRSADRTLAVGKGYTSYVRVVGGSACSRCAILAGIYSGETAFLRHVHCQCTTCPIPHTPSEGKPVPSGFHDSPQAYFDSLTSAEQNRVFTNAGAEAIRQGADPIKVVNARRSAYGIQYSSHGYIPANPGAARRTLTPQTIGVRADGSPLQVYTTAEGRYRGDFRRSQDRLGAQAVQDGRYRRTTAVRVMPEQLLKMAGNDPARWRELLSRYGYLN
jgi:hypothetical protein